MKTVYQGWHKCPRGRPDLIWVDIIKKDAKSAEVRTMTGGK